MGSYRDIYAPTVKSSLKMKVRYILFFLCQATMQECFYVFDHCPLAHCLRNFFAILYAFENGEDPDLLASDEAS